MKEITAIYKTFFILFELEVIDDAKMGKTKYRLPELISIYKMRMRVL